MQQYLVLVPFAAVLPAVRAALDVADFPLIVRLAVDLDAPGAEIPGKIDLGIDHFKRLNHDSGNRAFVDLSGLLIVWSHQKRE